MEKTYYNPKDLKKFGKVSEFQKELGDKFFDYYNTRFLPTVRSQQKKNR